MANGAARLAERGRNGEIVSERRAPGRVGQSAEQSDG